jgi:ABC-type dipeptide/oligopeptide/nickel transport system ATPase component
MLQSIPDTRTDVLLEVESLRTYFFLRGGILKAVDGVSFHLRPH